MPKEVAVIGAKAETVSSHHPVIDKQEEQSQDKSDDEPKKEGSGKGERRDLLAEIVDGYQHYLARQKGQSESNDGHQ